MYSRLGAQPLCMFMVVAFTSCVDESVKISEEDQKEICGIDSTISKIEMA